MSKLDPDKLHDIIDEEIQGAMERISERLKPLFIQELSRLAKKYPEVQGVNIGNGDWSFQLTPGSKLASRGHTVGLEGLPSDFRRIAAALDVVCDWRACFQFFRRLDLQPTES